YADWQDSCATLHMWTQIVGKVRLALAPPVNHWWHVPLYVTARGLTTSAMPYGTRDFQIDFDFIDHRLVIVSSDGGAAGFALEPRSVAEFHREVMAQLASLGIAVKLWTMPVEIEGAIPFEQDHVHSAYDKDAVNRFWRILVQCDRVFTLFRARFLGKVSPVHFFWGSFDLAVSRFSGRRAPERPGADLITRESYSHEVISHGFWPGSGSVKEPAFFAYVAPEPPGFKTASVLPAAASYNTDFSIFILPYEAVRTAEDPVAALTEFLNSTYDAGATLANWNREELERR
ncbi:MAG TPA: DUF5996 family protein, partial [Candidatus Eisenbacteria bacterium]|nr:DUF5996 family protein [Candidatus Eisenbacteria bacterium]